jgi:anti-sigma factor ChrR (cupin superfamily)
MYQVKVRVEEREWADTQLPGVTMKVLFHDVATGAMTVLTRLAAGATIPAHWHTHADETVTVLEGDFVEDGERYTDGAYFRGKAGTLHGPHHSVGGCLVVTHFSATLDFQQPPAPLTD